MSAKKLNIKPAPGVLVIEPQEAETKTASGIYLPETNSEKPQRGIVIAVGDDEITDNGAKRTKTANKGDEVIFKKWGGNEVKVNGKELLFAKFNDILAVVSK